MMVMNVFIHEIYIHVYVMYLINQLLVLLELVFKLWNVFLKILIGHLSKKKILEINLEIFVLFLI
jgi:hypothetical protein